MVSRHKCDEKPLTRTAKRVYTMRELNQHTARVLDEINDSGQEALITKHGRFVALIQPLRGAKLESVIFSESPLATEIHDRVFDHEGELTYTSDEVAEKIRARFGDAP